MYTVFLYISGAWTQYYPNLEGVKIYKERDDNYKRVVRTGLKGSLVFNDTEYDTLKALKDLDTKYVQIKIKYDSVDKLTGRLDLTGKWDENKSVCELTYQIVDDYSNILKNKDKEINMLLNTQYTIYKEQIVYVLTLTLPCFDGNVMEAQTYYDPKAPHGQISADPESKNAEWNYWTLSSTTACDGGFIYVFTVDYIIAPATGWILSALNGIYYRGIGTVNTLTPYERWVKHYDIMYDVLYAADPTILLNITTYCTYFTVTDTELQYLYVCNKSDIKRNTSSDRANFEMLNFEDWVEYHLFMFQLEWYIDDDGYFKFVRPSTYALPDLEVYPAHDLTDYKGLNYTDHQKRYIVKISNKFSKEKWQYELSSWTSDSFLDYETYDKTDKEYTLNNINNNVDYLITDPQDANDAGLCFAATRYDDSKYKIINKTDPFGGVTPYTNGKMKPDNLVWDHFKVNRPYTTAIHDSVLNAVTLTKEPDREVEYSNLPINDIDLIDFNYLVKSEVGNFRPDYFEIDLSLKEFSKLKGLF